MNKLTYSLLLVSAAALPQPTVDAPANLQPKQPPPSLYKVGGGVSAPSLLYKVEPEYSEEARQAGIQGVVVLYVEVDPNGQATNPRVIRSIGYGLDEKAIEAVVKWKFRPGYKDGKPVTVAATIEVNFRLLGRAPQSNPVIPPGPVRWPEEGSIGTSGPSRSSEQGASALRRGDYEAAKRIFLELTEVDPKSSTAWNSLGVAYAGSREYDKAEAAYKRQIEINPRDPYSYNNLALVYRALKRDDEAIAYFRKQIEVNPRDPFAHANLSLTFAAHNQWDDALPEAATAAEITPADPAKWYRLGRAQLKTGRMEEAEVSFEQVLAQPHTPTIANSIAYQMADAGVHLERAWQIVSGAISAELPHLCSPEVLSDQDSCSPQLHRVQAMLDTAGWILYRQGKLSEAEPYLLSAYAIARGVEKELHLSALFAKSGHLEQSLKYFAVARSRPEFSRFDSSDVRHELAKALGGELQLESRLLQIPIPTASETTARVIVLVDPQGKVLDAQAADSKTPDSVLPSAKSAKLLPIAWPEHALRSIRTMEFRQEPDSKWSLVRAYVPPARTPQRAE